MASAGKIVGALRRRGRGHGVGEDGGKQANSAICLRACYAPPGTDVAYDATPQSRSKAPRVGGRKEDHDGCDAGDVLSRAAFDARG